MAILMALLVFSVIILFHELGHFFAARAVGIDVEEFAIGFGPKLVGIKPGYTQFSIRLFPLGGYVRMIGEEGEAEPNNPASYQSKTPLQRMFVLAAGPLMNFVLALLLFVLIFGAFGGVFDPVIGSLVPGEPAAESGLQVGDRIISINSTPVETWHELRQFIQLNAGSTMMFSVQRNGERLELPVTPRDAGEFYQIGIGAPAPRRLPIGQSLGRGLEETYWMTTEIFRSIVKIFTRQVPADDITGPIGIVYYVGQAAQAGIVNVMSLAALISINLAIFNLLPIPALDGSKLVLLGVEIIRRKPLDPNKEGLVHLIGFALLITLMIVVMYRDVVKILGM